MFLFTKFQQLPTYTTIRLQILIPLYGLISPLQHLHLPTCTVTYQQLKPRMYSHYSSLHSTVLIPLQIYKLQTKIAPTHQIFILTSQKDNFLTYVCNPTTKVYPGLHTGDSTKRHSQTRRLPTLLRSRGHFSGLHKMPLPLIVTPSLSFRHSFVSGRRKAQEINPGLRYRIHLLARRGCMGRKSGLARALRVNHLVHNCGVPYNFLHSFSIC